MNKTMSKDKYPSTVYFAPNGGYCVDYSNIFHAVLKIGGYPLIFPSFSCGISVHVTRLDQSHVNKNI